MKKRPVRVIVFLTIFALLFGLFARSFSFFPDSRAYLYMRSFYDEPADSLQAVCVGSSNCYAFWNPLLAYDDYGIVVSNYACSCLPIRATEFVLREARKTQPDALYVVNINAADRDDMTGADLHYLINYMPDSSIRDELIDYISDLLGYSWFERLEYRFPWVRIHTKPLYTLAQIVLHGVIPEDNGLKGSAAYDDYLSSRYDVTENYIHSDGRAPLPEDLVESLDHLMDYCEAENVRVLFVAVPRPEHDENCLMRINAAADMIRARGFDVLSLTDEDQALGFDLTQDFYDESHTNIHASAKYTHFLSEYMIEHYGFEDRRGDPAYESWEAGRQKYSEIIAPHFLDFEHDAAHRDYSLAKPGSFEVSGDADAVELSWDAVAGADGYAVYRKEGNDGAWQVLEPLLSDTAFTDGTAEDGKSYTYTVVPLRIEGEERFYGNFFPNGRTVRAA